MNIEKLIENLHEILTHYGKKIPYGELVGASWPYSRAGDLVWQDPEPYFIEQAAAALSTLQAENKKLRAENIRWGQVASEQDKQLDKLQTALEQVKQCIEIVETQRDAAIKELENYMVQDALDGNKPCEICSKVSDTSCEYCNPKWRGPV